MQKPKGKSRAISTAKGNAWRAFSRFIRLRDCIRTTGDTEWGVCITCGKRVSFKGSQAGHFIAGRTNAILFDEDIVHLQCYSCNVCNHGEQLEYYYAMQKLGYTEDEITKMRQQRNVQQKYTADDYDEIALRYKTMADFLISSLKIYGPFSSKVSQRVELPHLHRQ